MPKKPRNPATIVRSRVRSWFDRQHATTSPANESHADFMDCLSHLEYLADMSTEPEPNRDRWPLISSALKKLDNEQLADLDDRIKRLRSDRRMSNKNK